MAGMENEVEMKGLKPSQCREHMRKELAKNFKEIVKGFVDEAKKGSCPHVKLTSELLLKTAPVKRASQKKGVAGRMLERLTMGEKARPERLRGRDGKFGVRSEGGERD